MYDARVGIISEGPLDQLLISRIISAEFPDQSFVFIGVSPTDDEIGAGMKEEGFGWGGVYKVCKHLKEKLEILKATGMCFDILVIHIDGDVMMMTYESARIIKEVEDGILPCFKAENSVAENCIQLMKVVDSWNKEKELKRVYCIPHINSDVWAAYALYENHRTAISEKMTKEELEKFLLQRGKREGKLIRKHNNRIRKEARTYKIAVNAITNELIQEMKNQFDQLKLFCMNVSELINEV